VVRGFQPLMPTFQGLISEEGLVSLIEYVRSLSPSASSTGAAGATPQGGVTPGADGRAAPTGGQPPQETIERATPGTRKPGSDR
jgi:hypothetical protein